MSLPYFDFLGFVGVLFYEPWIKALFYKWGLFTILSNCRSSIFRLKNLCPKAIWLKGRRHMLNVLFFHLFYLTPTIFMCGLLFFFGLKPFHCRGKPRFTQITLGKLLNKFFLFPNSGSNILSPNLIHSKWMAFNSLHFRKAVSFTFRHKNTMLFIFKNIPS